MSGYTLIVVVGFVILMAAAGVCVFRQRARLGTPLRALISLLCVPVAAFSVFGFLASFEPPASGAWMIGYAGLLFGMLAIGICPWLSSRT